MVAHHKVLEKLGEGGMGVVYKARDTHLDRFVALKILPPDKVSDPERRRRFAQEAKAASALNHPNIITIYDISSDGQHDYITMEYISGKTLDQCIGQVGLPLSVALKYGIQVADALARAHSAGIVHRDLKPSNIMVDPRGLVKVLDFGLAKLIQPSETSSDEESTLPLGLKTEEGVLLGTAAYMSPEQAQGLSVDAQTDIFSFGAVLYEMLSGRRPFQGKTTLDTLAAVLHSEPARLDSRVPQDLQKVVERCLRKDKERRYRHMDDVHFALQELKEELDSDKTTPVMPRRRSSLTAWGSAGGVFVVVSGVLAAWALWPPSQFKTRVTPLTADPLQKSSRLVVNGGRVLYAASESSSTRADLWSVSTTGGEPRVEPSPCPKEGFGVNIRDASYVQRKLLLSCQLDQSDFDVWLTDFDGGNAKWLARQNLREQGLSISPDLKTLLFSRPGGLSKKAVEGGAEHPVAQVSGIDIGPSSASEFSMTEGGGEANITFQRVVDGPEKLWQVRSDGTGMRLLLPEFAAEQRYAGWSPDDERLYFVSRGDLYLQQRRRWLGFLRTPAPVRLSAGPIQFGWSQEDPGNPRVIYAAGSIPQAEPMKLNRKSNVFEPFLPGIPADCISYSPDGEWIAYVSWPNGELWKCRKDGTGKALLEDRLFTFSPRWSPDGSRIAFSAREREATGHAQPFRIYTISALGGKSEPVVGVPGPAFDPIWSPDGKRLVFAPLEESEAAKNEQHVSIVNLETGALEKVPGSEKLFSVRWSPDGEWLAALTSDKLRLSVYSFATQKWTTLQHPQVYYPQWSKDNRHLYCLTPEPVITILRIEIPSWKIEPIRNLTDFALQGVMTPGAFWTPDEEPIVLKDLSTTQIYRIDRDR